MNPFNSYTLSVTINFPKIAPPEYSSFLSPNRLSFTEEGYPIRAEVTPLSIPQVITDSKPAYEEIMRLIGVPIIDEVKSEVFSAIDLIKELDEKFVQERLHQKDLFYKKKVDGDNAIVKLYEYHKHSSTREEEFPYLFQKLINLKKINDGLLNPKYVGLHELANALSFGREGHEIPFIQGPTLRQALEKALKVYYLADEIKNVPFNNIDIKL